MAVDSDEDDDANVVVAIGEVVLKRVTLPIETAAAAAAAAAADEAPSNDGGVGKTIPCPPGPAPGFADK